VNIPARFELQFTKLLIDGDFRRQIDIY